MITTIRKLFRLYKNPCYVAIDVANLPEALKPPVKRTLLFKGKHCGFEYYILDLGTHPTAYVKVDKDHPFYGKDYMDIPDKYDLVHGGLTYSEGHILIDNKLQNGWYFGWDYAHAGDFYAMPPRLLKQISEHLEGYTDDIDKQKKWKTKEIIRDCEIFCEALKRAKK